MGRDEKLKYVDGFFKWVAHFFSVFSAFGLCAWHMVLLGMRVSIIEQSM